MEVEMKMEMEGGLEGETKMFKEGRVKFIVDLMLDRRGIELYSNCMLCSKNGWERGSGSYINVRSLNTGTKKLYDW